LLLIGCDAEVPIESPVSGENISLAEFRTMVDQFESLFESHQQLEETLTLLAEENAALQIAVFELELELEQLSERADLTGVENHIADLDFRLSSVEGDYVATASLEKLATKVWVEEQAYAAAADLTALSARTNTIEADYLRSTDLSGYATEAWVLSQSYGLSSDLISVTSRVSTLESDSLTASDLSDYATRSWIQDQDFASAAQLTGLDTRLAAVEGDYASTSDLTNFLTAPDLAPLQDRVSTIENDYLQSSNLTPLGERIGQIEGDYLTSADLVGYVQSDALENLSTVDALTAVEDRVVEIEGANFLTDDDLDGLQRRVADI